jgi:hypothetical protein
MSLPGDVDLADVSELFEVAARADGELLSRFVVCCWPLERDP